MESTDSLIKVSSLLLNQVFLNTNYENNDEAKLVYDEMQTRLQAIATRDKQGIDVTSKFSSFASGVTSKDSLKDMIKIIWRTVKTKTGQPQYKLSLFILAMASLVRGINSTYNRYIDAWVDGMVRWLGNQLTIGGKGVIGDGKGSVVERMNQFFATPYLHDFD